MPINMSEQHADQQVDQRITWVEPEMTELNVTETQRRPRFGRDGGNYPDCQLS